MPRLPLILAAALLAACGQTGPLYLPDEGVTTPVETRPPAGAAPGAVQPAPAGPPAQAPAPPAAEPEDDEESPSV
jgi:predicted small lipoprotein YifL